MYEVHTTPIFSQNKFLFLSFTVMTGPALPLPVCHIFMASSFLSQMIFNTLLNLSENLYSQCIELALKSLNVSAESHIGIMLLQILQPRAINYEYYAISS